MTLLFAYVFFFFFEHFKKKKKTLTDIKDTNLQSR